VPIAAQTGQSYTGGAREKKSLRRDSRKLMSEKAMANRRTPQRIKRKTKESSNGRESLRGLRGGQIRTSPSQHISPLIAGEVAVARDPLEVSRDRGGRENREGEPDRVERGGEIEAR